MILREFPAVSASHCSVGVTHTHTHTPWVKARDTACFSLFSPPFTQDSREAEARGV